MMELMRALSALKKEQSSGFLFPPLMKGPRSNSRPGKGVGGCEAEENSIGNEPGLPCFSDLSPSWCCLFLQAKRSRQQELSQVLHLDLNLNPPNIQGSRIEPALGLWEGRARMPGEGCGWGGGLGERRENDRVREVQCGCLCRIPGTGRV